MNLPKLPSMPKLKSQVRCACGCDGLTQSRFVPGHDSKLYGWMRRVKAGVFTSTPDGHAVDPIAQIDAAMQWLTPKNGLAIASAMGIKWTEAEFKARQAKAAKATA